MQAPVKIGPLLSNADWQSLSRVVDADGAAAPCAIYCPKPSKKNCWKVYVDQRATVVAIRQRVARGVTVTVNRRKLVIQEWLISAI